MLPHTHTHTHTLKDNVDFAMEKLSQFKEFSQWYDPLLFCEPTFIMGNGLLMSPGIILYSQ